MALWKNLFVFRGDTLIAEGIDPLQLKEYSTVSERPEANGNNSEEHYTKVIVSGYALYGELRGYYAVGVSHMFFDDKKRTAYQTPESAGFAEKATSLSGRQREIIRECLMRISPLAWEASNRSFRQAFQAKS